MIHYYFCVIIKINLAFNILFNAILIALLVNINNILLILSLFFSSQNNRQPCTMTEAGGDTPDDRQTSFVDLQLDRQALPDGVQPDLKCIPVDHLSDLSKLPSDFGHLRKWRIRIGKPCILDSSQEPCTLHTCQSRVDNNLHQSHAFLPNRSLGVDTVKDINRSNKSLLLLPTEANDNNVVTVPESLNCCDLNVKSKKSFEPNYHTPKNNAKNTYKRCCSYTEHKFCKSFYQPIKNTYKENIIEDHETKMNNTSSNMEAKNSSSYHIKNLSISLLVLIISLIPRNICSWSFFERSTLVKNAPNRTAKLANGAAHRSPRCGLSYSIGRQLSLKMLLLTTLLCWPSLTLAGEY